MTAPGVRLGSLGRAARFLRTVRHLRAEQIFHRMRLSARRALWTRLPGRVDAGYRQRASRRAHLRFDHPGLARVAALRLGRRPGEAALRTARNALEGRFTLLGVSRELGRDVDWYRADLDVGTRLWKTRLHEFSYAIDLARAHRETGDPAFRERLFELAHSWAEASPIGRPGFARDAWNARAVATRLVNWALAASLLELSPDADPDGAFFAREIGVHALFLRDNLEWDLRGNHLWRDCVGLVFAEALGAGVPDALALLRRQLEEQILADGCHVERVPFYHALALQDLVEVRALLGRDSPSWLEQALARMAGFLAHLLPQSGRLPLFGDTWHGELDPLRLLEEAGDDRKAPDDASTSRHSGLVVLRRGVAHAVVRAGAHGPDWQLGHAHADALSFELGVDAAAVVTDTGNATYDPGAARDRARGTTAHNTLQIDGQEQIEAWGSFRVGRRGRARVAARGSHAGWEWVSATYDGWRWLPGQPLHHRLLALSEVALVVLDAVEGGGRHRLRSALHLHPDLTPDQARVEAFRGPIERTRAPLHERVNETRDATELYIETEGELPWSEGWIVIFADVAGPIAAELHEEEGRLHARVRHPSATFDLRWRPGAAARDALELSLCPALGASAT